MKVSPERATRRLIAFDVLPEADYDTVFERLASLQEEGVLEFEEAWGDAEGHPKFTT